MEETMQVAETSVSAVTEQAVPQEQAAPMVQTNGQAEEIAAERNALASAREQSRMERARLTAEQQVREITRMDGRIQSMNDLIAMPEYGEFYERVKKGMSLVDAYKLTCYDRLVQQAAEAAARQTMRSVAGRQHLTALAGQPGEAGSATVPTEVAAEFRLAKPGITEQEIRRRWQKFQTYKRQ